MGALPRENAAKPQATRQVSRSFRDSSARETLGAAAHHGQHVAERNVENGTASDIFMTPKIQCVTPVNRRVPRQTYCVAPDDPPDLVLRPSVPEAAVFES